MHEDHVDVTDVVELVAAALAHRNNREPRIRGRLPDPGPRDGPGCFEGPGGQVRALRGYVVDPDVVGQVARGQAQPDPGIYHPPCGTPIAVGPGFSRATPGQR